MTKRRFLYNKLVRDKTAQRLQAQGATATIKVLEDNDMFLEAITQKIIEELEEVFSSESQQELMSELADFDEAFSVFKTLLKIDQKELDALRARKLQERGSYTGRLFCEYADVPTTSTELIKYLEENEDRYPELDPKTNNFLNPEHSYEDDAEDEEGDED